MNSIERHLPSGQSRVPRSGPHVLDLGWLRSYCLACPLSSALDG